MVTCTVQWLHVSCCHSAAFTAWTVDHLALLLLQPSSGWLLCYFCDSVCWPLSHASCGYPLSRFLLPAQSVLPNVGKKSPWGRSLLLSPVLQNEGGNTDRCLLSSSSVSTLLVYIATEMVFTGTTANLPHKRFYLVTKQDNAPFVPVPNGHFARPPWRMLPVSGLGSPGV